MTNKFDIKTYIISLFLPIYGLVNALRNLRTKNIVVPITLFYAFVGLFSLYEGTNLDTARYAEWFEYACELNKGFWDYHTSRATLQQVDFYTSLVTWFFSRFLSSPHLFIAILAGIMGFVFAKNIDIVRSNTNLNSRTCLLFVLLVFVPQAVFFPHRWWTAMQVFLLGVIPYLLNGNKKYLWISVSSVFVHFSFLYMVVLLVGYIFMPKKGLLPLLVLFIATALLSGFDFTQLTPYLESYLPGAQVERTTMYMEWKNEEKNFLSQSATLFFKLSSIALFVTIYLRTNWYKDSRLKNLFIFTLLFASVTQVMSLSPVGVRFKDFTNIIITIFLIVFYSQNHDIKCDKVFKYCIPIFVYYVIYQIRGVLDCIGPGGLVFGNFVDFFLIDDEVSVLGHIKQII